MNLRKILLANYVGQVYTSLMSMFFVPHYLNNMGAEAYGLIGFYSMLFSLFYIFDMGLTPIISRESSRFIAGQLTAKRYVSFVKSISILFLIVALLGIVLLYLISDWIVFHWFKLQELSFSSAKFVVHLMILSVAIRWVAGGARGVLTGGEQIIWISTFNSVVATFRFAFVLIFMSFFGYTIEVFFEYQLAISIFEIIIIFYKVRYFLPIKNSNYSISSLRRFLRFGVVTAFASVLNLMVMQIDKFLLSGMLPLTDYGNVSLAMIVATSIIVVSSPICSSLMPKMARLEAENRGSELVAIYRLSTRVTSALALGGSIALALCAKPLLIAWTGNANWADKFWPILSSYAIGNGFWAIASLPYYLQYAKGEMKWYLIGNLSLFLIQIPLVYYSIDQYGALGSGIAWILLSASYLFFYAGLVHRTIDRISHMEWLCNDVLFMNWPMILGSITVGLMIDVPATRQYALLYVISIGGGLMLMNICWLLWLERAVWLKWFNSPRGAI